MIPEATTTSRGKTISIFVAVAVAALILFSVIFFIIKIYFFSAPYSISGAIGQEDGTPLEGIKVFAQNIDVEKAIYSTSSDMNGNYRIKLDREGDYYIWTDNENGYVDMFYNNKSFNQEPDRVSISVSSKNKDGVNFILPRGFFIKGRIVYADRGLESILVDVYLKDGTWVSGSKTTADGEFSIGLLLPGVYYLRTWGARIYDVDDIWFSGPAANQGKVPPDDAMKIEVAGTDVDLMDINLMPGRVAGGEEVSGETAEPSEETPQLVEQVSFVKITNPDQDFIIGEKIKVNVDVSADVTTVAFYVNDELSKVDREAPFFYRWKVKAGEHLISAIAYDQNDQIIATDSIKVNR
ncbi:MAG: Ig-like domain-containing protein [Actinobacteria bacterium]|nr:Ig-like domain-containing protein [Actinomycetota bacterium]